MRNMRTADSTSIEMELRRAPDDLLLLCMANDLVIDDAKAPLEEVDHTTKGESPDLEINALFDCLRTQLAIESLMIDRQNDLRNGHRTSNIRRLDKDLVLESGLKVLDVVIHEFPSGQRPRL